MLAATLTTLAPRMRFKFYKPKIDNIVFKLHYQLTVTILLAFVILVCSREYFGDHIRCLADQGVPTNVIQTYCFFMATFTIVRHYNESLLQAGFLPHPGVGPLSDHDETLHHTYYQWVPFALFIQSLCFYLPHYIWKSREGGRISALVNGLHNAGLSLINDKDMTVNGTCVQSRANLDSKLETIKKDILLRLRISQTWSIWLVSMEVANLVHVVIQIYVIDKFLNSHFMSLGLRVMGHSNWEDISDPLETVFPKVTKCVFHKYGPSGSIQQHDALCVMALNIIHEKIYTVLWFWLFFLFFASLAAVIWRAISFVMYRRSIKFNTWRFPNGISDKFNPYNVLQVVNGCQFGDWLFLYYLAQNMSSFVFIRLYDSLAEELKKREVPTGEKDEDRAAGAEPMLISSKIDYSDETLPLKEDTKL